MTPEGEIKKSIMAYLRSLPLCYPRLIVVKGLRGRTNPSKGIFDIVVTYRGRSLSVEVKTPSGTLSLEQSDYLLNVRAAGGFAIVARSVEDVRVAIEKIDYCCKNDIVIVDRTS
jgi:hypothetical protein